jgi:uncharacterized membrane protein YjfL (UPF0719 family)
MSMYFNFPSLVSALLFVALGLIVYFLALRVVVTTAKAALGEREDSRHDVALAILIGALALGVSIIVAAAVH